MVFKFSVRVLKIKTIRLISNHTITYTYYHGLVYFTKSNRSYHSNNGRFLSFLNNSDFFSKSRQKSCIHLLIFQTVVI